MSRSPARQAVAKPTEQGFALLMVLWFLLLAGGIVSVLMLTTLRRAEQASDWREDSRHQLAIESAMETAVADVLYNGPRSRWALLPAEGAYEIDGIRVELSASSEGGKVDVNNASPEVIAETLEVAGFSREFGREVVRNVEAARIAGHRFETVQDFAARFDGSALDGSDRVKLCGHFTIFSGITGPSVTCSPNLGPFLAGKFQL